MKTLITAVLLTGIAWCQKSMVCKRDEVHEVCRFSDGSVTETIANKDGASVFHWTKAQAIKLGHRLDVQPSYEEQRAARVHKYMQQGMTLDEANKKVHDEVVQKEDPGVTKVRIDLCKQGILKGERCKDAPQEKH